MKELNNRVAIVTGAGSGIGRGLALALAEEGCRVVASDIEAEPLAATGRALDDAGVEYLTVQTDVTDAKSVAAMKRQVLDRFGTVNVLCNNAGVGGGGLIKNSQLVDWKWVIDVSLWGVIHGIDAFLPVMIDSGDAHIISTGSVAGLMPTPGLGPYNAAKYGVVAIMETLYLEMQADETANVGVSVLCPGPVNTNIANAQRNRPVSLQRERTAGRPSGNSAKRRNDHIADLLAQGMDPAQAAAAVIAAIYDDQFWILTHPEFLADIQHRNDALQALDNPSELRDAFEQR